MLRILTIVACLVLLGAPPAPATTGSGQQNTDLLVAATVTPDVATDGDMVTVTATVTNQSRKSQAVAITANATAPDGSTFTYSEKVVLSPGETYSRTESRVVEPADARGTYTFAVSGTARRGTSTATATTTYV